MAKAKRSTIVKKLDTVFSRYIRKREADYNGIAECFTCGRKAHWKDLQCGHFQTRKKYSTRWHELNVAPQCGGCNMYNGGQQYIFGLKIDKIHGEGTAEDLVRQSNQITKYSNLDLINLTKHYQKLLNELE